MTSFYGGGAASTSGGESVSIKGALIFKGTLGISDDGATVLVLPDEHEEGWTYLVVTAGTYAGQLCEKGDFIICVSSGEAASDLDWTVVQGNTFNTLPTPTALDEGKIISVDTSGNYVLIDNPSSGETENLPDPSEADEGKILSVGADGNYILTDNSAKDKLDKANPTYTGSLTGENATFTGSVQVSTPDQDNEAANKSYVDAIHVQALADAKNYTDSEITNLENGTTELPYIKNNGDTVTGSYDLTGAAVTIAEPASNNSPATKKYVDDKAGDYLPLVGGTMTGSINAGENTVTNLKEPEEGTDATTKNYVDEKVARAAPVSIIPIPEVSGENLIQIKDSVEWPLQGMRVYGKSTQTSTTGAQLFPINKTASANGFTVTPNEDGTINITGTPSAKYANILSTRVTLQPGTYYLSSNGSTSAGQMTPQVIIEKADETTKYIFNGSFAIEQGDNSEVSLVIQYQSAELTAVNLSNYFVMLNAGSTALPFEPYTGGKPSPSPEYPQPIVSAGDGGEISITVSGSGEQSQSLTFSTPDGLPGIPVDSGGNFVDKDGQEWICNYRDWARGVDVKCIDTITALEITRINIGQPDGGWVTTRDTIPFYFDYSYVNKQKPIADGGLCSYFTYSLDIVGNDSECFFVKSDRNYCAFRIQKTKLVEYGYDDSDQEGTGPSAFLAWLNAHSDLQIFYAVSPTETPIPAGELTAYKALHTYDGTIVISTDENISGLKVKYVAKAIDYQQSINAAIQETNDKIDAVYNSLVKKAESVDEVNQLFKDWWNANWEEGSSTYNDMLERWFGKVLDDDKVYGVKLPLFETSTSSQGEYIEDSIGLTITNSTDEDVGQNDFAKTPQFWCVEVAAEKNADGSHTIYACEFIDDTNVVRNGGPGNGKHLVWVLQKNTYVREYEESGYSYIKIQCYPAESFVQWPQGTDRTGHTYSYIANPKYAAGIDDEGNIGCRTGLKPTCYMSMNETIQSWRARGPQYSGSSACFYKWAYIMFALLTAKKGDDVGCNNYSYQYAAAVSESGVSRIILTTGQANNLYVGSNVIIGNTEGNNDRGQAAMYSLVKLRKISSIEEVNIEEDASSYKAVYIDVPDETTFDTTAGTTYISTMPYYSGWTDTVKGTIGTKYNTNLNKQPFLLQKVELMNGAYNYASDELDQWSQQDDTHYLYDFYLCEDQTKVSTNGTITGDYIKKENATLTIDTAVYTTNNSWYYVEDNLTDNNFKMLSPKKFSASAGSGTGTRDAFYLSYAASGVRMPVVWASLLAGGGAGLSCRLSSNSPSWANWNYAGGGPGLSG